MALGPKSVSSTSSFAHARRCARSVVCVAGSTAGWSRDIRCSQLFSRCGCRATCAALPGPAVWLPFSCAKPLAPAAWGAGSAVSECLVDAEKAQRRAAQLLSLARGERLHGSRQQNVARRRLSEDPLLRRLISRARSSPTSNSRSAWIAIAAPRAARSPNEELCPCAAVSTRPHESTSRHQQRIRQCNSWRTGETYHCAHVRDLGVHSVVVYCC